MTQAEKIVLQVAANYRALRASEGVYVPIRVVNRSELSGISFRISRKIVKALTAKGLLRPVGVGRRCVEITESGRTEIDGFCL